MRAIVLKSRKIYGEMTVLWVVGLQIIFILLRVCIFFKKVNKFCIKAV